MFEESKIKDLDTGRQIADNPDLTSHQIIQEELSKLTEAVSRDIYDILESTRRAAREIVNEEKNRILKQMFSIKYL